MCTMAMARSDERTPLLVDVESVDSYDLKTLPSASLNAEDGLSDEDLKLVAVFVTTFDTRHGAF